MKPIIRLIPVLALLILINTHNSDAQIRDFGNFATTGSEDAEALFTAYLSPFLNGFGASMTGGWYTTAKTHKPGGFDLTISTSAAIVPQEFRSFNVDELQLTNLRRVTGSSEESSTLAGSLDEGPAMEYAFENYSDTAFSLPPGAGIAVVPSPMIQLGIGLIKGTDLVGRYMPQVGVEGKGKYGFWGVGIRHDIKQWIPVFKNTPVLHLSVMGGYTRMNSYVDLSVDPESLNLGAYSDLDASVWENQRMVASSGSFTGNLIASVNLPVITIYGGAGFAYTKSNLLLEGNYPMITGVQLVNEQVGPVVEAVADPIDIIVENQDGGFTKARLNLGIRFKMLKVLALNVDYTRANFNVVTVGLGVTFR